MRVSASKTIADAEADTGVALWIAFILLFKLFYIPFELSYNTHLVDAVGTGASLDDLHGVEIFGRCLSTVAVIVLGWRLVGWRRDHASRSVLVWLGIALSAAPIVFFGQKLLINYIADHSSGASRRTAALMRFVPGLVNNAEELRGREVIQGFDFEGWPEGSKRTFLSISGTFFFFSGAVVHSVEEAADNIAYNEVLRRQLDASGGSPWQRFVSLRQATASQYEAYTRLTREQRAAEDQAADEAVRQWKSLRDDIESQERQAATEYGSVTDYATETRLYGELQRYFAEQSSFLVHVVDRKYVEKCNVLYGKVIPDDYWCSATQCPVDFSEFRRRHERLIAARFPGANGSGSPISTSDSGKNLLTSHIIGELESKGVHLPASWTIDDEGSFVSASVAAAHRKASEEVAARMRAIFGADLPENLSWQDFWRQQRVQSKIRAGIEAFTDLPAGTMLDLDWTRGEFERIILVPALQSRAQALKDQLIGPAASYENGARRAQSGRDAVRYMLVPALGLTLSAFFGLLTVISAAILGAQIFSQFWRKMGNYAILACIVLELVTPFIVTGSIVQSPGYHFVLDSAAPSRWIWTIPVRWLLHTEPFVYPTGAFVQRHFVGRDFFAIDRDSYRRIDDLDKRIYSLIEG